MALGLGAAGALSLGCGSKDKAAVEQAANPGAGANADEADAGGGLAAGGAAASAGGANVGMGGAPAASGSGGAGGLASAIPSGPTDGRIGTGCASDDGCQPGLSCLSPAANVSTLGGPAGGWCTLACTTDAQCSAVSPIAICVPLDDNGTPEEISDDTGFCTELCLLGTPEQPELENKCHQRAEVACIPFPSQDPAVPATTGFCLSSCASDSACGDRFCDTQSGFCVDEAPAGAEVGADCVVGADDCKGYCTRTSAADETLGMCTAQCTIGAGDACGHEPGSTEPWAQICLPPGSLSYLGIGDIGMCFETCDCNDDCSKPGNLCLAFGDAAAEAAVQKLGICVPPASEVNLDAGVVAADAGTPGIACAP